ncbi:DEAD/DEAH box helicase family protein [Staphylothermus marinus]|uniref:DEAD/DEAH box helicase family protein n=1 Tax=Staphylothermus marinus TaxID=2280 RepID=UPI00069B4384|nr:DEAD/DEAH box helicase family protein [Staphylothermus marinus]
MMNDPLSRFNNVVEEKLGFTLRKYQEVVASEIVESVRKGCKFIIVSMPTGSGKTLVEMFTAFYGLESGVPRILVLEPTRFLCDQMYSGASGSSGGGLWRIVFGDAVGREYEGDCSSFLEPGKKSLYQLLKQL